MATTSDRQALTPAPSYSVHEKQREVVTSDARFKVLEWGRRAGKNITAVIEQIEYGRAPWLSPWGSDDPENVKVWWVARSYDQAEKYGFLPMLSALPDAWIDGSPKRSEPYQINLTTGVTYEFRTYDHPETLQGAGVDKMLVDEADYMKDTLWYDDLEPMLMDTRGAATFISKPVRPRSYFQTLAERGKSPDWPDHFYSHATSADNPFIEEDPMDKRGAMPDAKFRQQYLAELPDDGGQVFKEISERLFTAEYDLHGEMHGDGSGVTGEVWADPEVVETPCSVGADFAQSRDYRVTLALDAAGRVVYFKRSQNESWADIQAHLEAAHEQYPGVVVPDASRDNKIIADLWNAGVEMEPTKFSPQEKKRLIEELITDFERGRLSAPDDPLLSRLRMELRVMEKEVTGSGYSKYHAPSGEYDDTVDALALANRGLERAGADPSTTASIGGSDDTGGLGDSPLGAAVREYQRGSGGNPWK